MIAKNNIKNKTNIKYFSNSYIKKYRTKWIIILENYLIKFKIIIFLYKLKRLLKLL